MITESTGSQILTVLSFARISTLLIQASFVKLESAHFVNSTFPDRIDELIKEMSPASVIATMPRALIALAITATLTGRVCAYSGGPAALTKGLAARFGSNETLRRAHRTCWRPEGTVTGMLTHGHVTIKAVVSRTREAATCAALCARDSGCTSFAFSFLERQCFLLSDAQLAACDPAESPACSDTSSALQRQLSSFARCHFCEFFEEDNSPQEEQHVCIERQKMTGG